MRCELDGVQSIQPSSGGTLHRKVNQRTHQADAQTEDATHYAVFCTINIGSFFRTSYCAVSTKNTSILCSQYEIYEKTTMMNYRRKKPAFSSYHLQTNLMIDRDDINHRVATHLRSSSSKRQMVLLSLMVLHSERCCIPFVDELREKIFLA